MSGFDLDEFGRCRYCLEGMYWKAVREHEETCLMRVYLDAESAGEFPDAGGPE